MKEGNHRFLITAFALAAVGLYLRVWGIWDFWFSPDDLLHTQIANAGGPIDIYKASFEQMHPPLLYYVISLVSSISLNPYVLRSIPLAFGTALTLLMFVAGRKTLGNVGGIAMAYFSALSYSAIILSQILRHYIILTCFFCLALWAYSAYNKEPRNRHLVLYAAMSVLMVLTHYAAVILIASMGAVWFAKTALQKRSPMQCARIAAVQLPSLITFLFLYFYHISALQGLYVGLRDSYLKPHFPDTIAGLAKNLYLFMDFMFFEPLTPLVIILFVIGMFGLFKKYSPDLAVTIILCFLINFALTLMDKYPFGGIRHSFYLFPLSALAVGAGVQFLFDHAGILANVKSFGGILSWSKKHPMRLEAAGLLLVMASTVPFMSHYGRYSFGRRMLHSGGYSWFEFPVKMESYNRLMDTLKYKAKAGDLILGNRQAFQYFNYASGYNKVVKISENLWKVPCQGITAYFMVKYLFFHNSEQLLLSLREAMEKTDVSGQAMVWVVNIGWGGDAKSSYLAGSDRPGLVLEEVEGGGVSLCRFKLETLIGELERSLESDRQSE